MAKKRSPKQIAQAIKAAIRERDLTAYRLAQMSGVSVTAIQRWLNGERTLSLPNAEKLAAALDLVLAPKEVSP